MIRYLFIVFLSINCLAKPNSLMFIGDSLTAGFQLPIHDTYPAIIQKKVGTQNIHIINAGVSGDTTYSVLERLDFTLTTTPNIVFLCIGANDGLRGIAPSITHSNITTIINELRKRNISVVLAGISLPKNYSPTYINAFENTFKNVANEQNIPFMPFLLKDVAGIPTLNLTDRIHPNKKGHQIIAKNVFNFLRKENIISSKNKLIQSFN
ncbi:arylesterase [Candidatus Marinamargulisbacteria bacterium SCGC AG-343-K17]|nr:arylesterase [Candidatus Marinamargulisbacteria bacterium SCGC AG-343-K17]